MERSTQEAGSSITGTGLDVRQTSPTIVSPTITGATVSSQIQSDTKVLAAAATTTSSTHVALTGFSWTVVAGKTYVFDLWLPVTCTTTGGTSASFVLTTATLTSIQYQFYLSTAADNTTAVSGNGTTAASGTKFFNSKTAAYTLARVRGSFVVNAGGTFAIHAGQETTASGGDSTIYLLGGQATLTRVL